MKTRCQTRAEVVDAGVAAGPSISPPKKKLKTMESKVERSEAPAMRRNQHRLSVLPSLPLDILYEIFFRISPRDLLNLTYTNKAFRKLLLSRDSRFVWSTVLSSMEKQLYPPPPEDMSEPAWANLVWGKPDCTTCGAKAPKILWRLRRRACKNCAKQHLTTGGIGMPTFCYQSRTVPVSLFLPAISARTIESHWREVYHMWDEDVYAFQAEIKALRDQYPSTADFVSASEVYLTQMLERRQSIDKHADLCAELKTKRASERADELEVLKQQRFEHIKARLLALGYEEQDINHFNIRHHRQVRVSKPLTDRVWSVIGPIIRSDVDEVRDERLGSAKQRRYNERKGMVAAEYVALLRNIAPSILTFMPNLDNLLNLPLVAAVTEQDCEVSPELFENICDALYSSSEDIEWWIRVRLTRLEALIPSTWAKPPQDWVFEPFPQSCLKFVDVDDTLYSLDLAAYVFHCPPSPMCPTFDSCIHGEQYFVGLEALAHQCNLSDSSELRILPDQHGHEAVMQALELLKMDPHTTTVLQMDLLGRYFLCDCSLEEPEARGVMTWRGVIQHATTLHKSAPLRLRMLTPLEQLYSLLRNPEPICHRAAVWGCAYCTAHLNLAHASGGVNLNHWFGWQGIKKHLREEHDVERIVEGRDLFSNRTGRFWNERIRDIPTDLDIAKLKHFVDELVVCGRVPEK